MNWLNILTLNGRINVHNVFSLLIAPLVLVYWYIYMSSPEPPGYYLALPLLFILPLVTFLAFDSDRGETFEVIGEIVLMNIFYIPYRFIKEKHWEVTGRTLLLNGTSLFIMLTIWFNQLGFQMEFILETVIKGLLIFLFLTVTIYSRLSSLKNNYVEVKEGTFQRAESDKKEDRTYDPKQGEF